jgi:hypothetical protein
MCIYYYKFLVGIILDISYFKCYNFSITHYKYLLLYLIWHAKFVMISYALTIIYLEVCYSISKYWRVF